MNLLRRNPMLLPVIGLTAGIYAADVMAGGMWTSQRTTHAVASTPHILPYTAAILVALSFIPDIWHAIRCRSAGKRQQTAINADIIRSRLMPLQIMLFSVASGMAAAYASYPALQDTASLSELPPGYKTLAVVERRIEREQGTAYRVDIRKVLLPDGRSLTARNLGAQISATGRRLDIGDYILTDATWHDVNDVTSLHAADYTLHMRRNGVYINLTWPYTELVAVSHIETPASVAACIRGAIASAVEESGLERSTREFVNAILIGEDSLLDPDIREAFKATGIAHILALSGMHTGIMASLFALLLIPLRLIPGTSRLRHLLCILFVWVYSFITGFEASTIRAAAMLTVALAAIMAERRLFSFNSLFTAMAVTLLVRPSDMFGAGFLLTFGCVAALLAFPRKLNHIDASADKRLHKGLNAILSILVITLCTWPLQSVLFGHVTPLSLPANLLALPLLPFFMSGALLYMALYALDLPCRFVGHLLDNIYRLLSETTAGLATSDFSGLPLSVGAATAWTWLAGCVLLYFALPDARDIAADSSRMPRLRKLLPSLGVLTMSIITIPVFKAAEPPDALMLRDNGSIGLRLTLRASGVELVREMTHDQLESISIDRFKIRKADNLIASGHSRTSDAGKYEAVCHIGNPEPCDLLIIADRITETPEQLFMRYAPRNIFLATTIHHKEEKALYEALSTHLDSVRLDVRIHSSRQDGPLILYKTQ